MSHIETADTLELRRGLIDAGRWIYARGWCPATGGNFSARSQTDDSSHTSRYLVTASGRDKGALTEQDFLEVDDEGAPLIQSDEVRPSAETLVHVMLYQLDPEIGAVLHAHSIPNTVLSLAEPSAQLKIQGFEMQKALQGERTHEAEISLEIFDNTQDMQALAQSVKARWGERSGLKWGLLVRGHGVYAWGRDIQEARRHLEGLEFLFSCLLELKKIGAASR